MTDRVRWPEGWEDGSVAVRDIGPAGNSLPLERALLRAESSGFYPKWMWDCGNFTRVVFVRHPDTSTSETLPDAFALAGAHHSENNIADPLEGRVGHLEAAFTEHLEEPSND